MIVTEQMIDNLAELSKLYFTDAEKKEISSDLEKMIAFVNKLKELDTKGVSPLMHMSGSENLMRDDVAKSFKGTNELIQQSPVNNGLYVKVPKVIQK